MQHPYYSPQMSKAFTLIELLIALLIIGLLLTISYPTYTHHILKLHRAEAQTGLMKIAEKLEQYYSLQGSYQGAHTPPLSETFYRFEITANTDSFLISAIPIGSQARDACGVLSYDQTGKKAMSGQGKPEECW